MSLRSLDIAPRASLGFGLLALMVFVLGAFALMQMANMRQQSDEVESNWLPSVMSVGDMSQDLLRLRALTLRLLINRDPQALAQSLWQRWWPAAVAREVDRNLMNIRNLALQASAGTNQTSAASQELSRLAVDLNSMVARFSV